MNRAARRALIALPIVVAFLGASAALCAWSPEVERSLPAKPTGLVRSEPVQAESLDRALRVSGVTRARQRATLSFAVPARLASRPVQTGQRVKKGQIVATLEAAQFRHAASAADASVAEVNVRLSQARRDLARVEPLRAAGALAEDQVEQARSLVQGLEAALAAAQAQRSDARRLLSEATIRAPFDGTVTAVGLEPGELAAPGHPIALISGEGALQLEVELPESAALRVREESPVRVELPLEDRRVVAGRVASVALAAIGPGRLFTALIDLDSDDRVVAGMTADAVLDVRGEEGVRVPIRAVLNPGSARPFVFRVHDGTAQRVDIELGALLGACVVVRSSLSDGDRVVVDGHTSLIDGDAVREAR